MPKGKTSPAVEKAPNPVGRPTSYKPEYADLAYKFCLMGASDTKLAELLGVSVATIYNWQNNVPEFLEAVKAGKEKADAEIAFSLFQRAKGYSHPEVDVRVISGEIVQTPMIKHYPPDTAAATLWLKNRQGHVWRDKVENVHQNPDGTPLDLNLKVTFVNPHELPG